jgi:Fic family protein
MLALEEAIEENREDYYQALLPNKKDVTPFVSFFVQTIADQSEKLITRLTQPTSNLTFNILSPRRQEILSIITDHHQVSFDFIRRRFISVPVSTLHNDLFYLQKHGFIQKLGVTKGVWYTLKEDE